MQHQDALVVGPLPLDAEARDVLLGSTSYVVAVDGGLAHCHEYGIVPDLIVGDFDSLPDATELLGWAHQHDIEIVQVPPDKDYTDLSLALMVCRDLAIPQTRVIGCFGGLLDHQLAVLGSMAAIADCSEVMLMGPDGQKAHILANQDSTCEVPADYRFSVIALSGQACVSVTGARWNLMRQQLSGLSDWGVSNHTEAGVSATVTAHEGTVCVTTNPL